MIVAPTTDFADLVFHALAHLPLSDHTTLFDPRYLAWAERLPEETRAPFAEDATVLVRRWALRDAGGLQFFPILQASIADFLVSARKEFRELRSDDVGSAPALDALRRVDEALVEILRADLALAAREYEAVFAERIRPELARFCDPIAALSESLARHLPERIELSSVLGPRGRALGARIVVGAPLAWAEIETATPIVLALHEHLVRTSTARGADRYAATEWDALVRGADIVAGGAAEIAPAHARWVERLALRPLLDRLVALGTIDAPFADRLERAGAERAAMLRSLD
jgi:hypothetical protein